MADSPSDRPAEPRVSIIIPIYNEEAILQSAVVDLVDRLSELDEPYELILAENGSTDDTVKIANELAERFPQLVVRSLGQPNYGEALKRGILEARGEFVLCDEIDLCDTDFHRRALALLETGEADFVVGSKTMAGASDERPVMRHAATLVMNGLLRVATGFKGSDTHGLKAFRRAPVVEIARQCLVDKDLFASELVIRAERAGVRMKEIPVRVLEKRPPSIHLFRRVPNVLKGVAKLFVAIRVKG
ncbi:MAG: glycosyl transferase family 2 [Sandaracinus sp.]|mgnify:CR=1 FL=1|nr:glycosyl transferase family 2 [Sandaracinus sp.]